MKSVYTFLKLSPFWNEKYYKKSGELHESLQASLATIDNVQVDSRLVNARSLFIALPGKHTHGHNYVHDAKTRGAVAAMVEDYSSAKNNTLTNETLDHFPQLRVQSTYAMLILLAQYETQQVIRIGITGSMGKTTTCYWSYEVLKHAHPTYWYHKNYNNHVGLPIAMINTSDSAKIGIYELGMSNKGEIEKLSYILKPHIALITNVGESHMENFHNLSEIAKEKASIFKGLTQDGIPLLASFSSEYATLQHQLAQYNSQSLQRLLTFGYQDKDTVKINHSKNATTIQINRQSKDKKISSIIPMKQYQAFEYEILSSVVCIHEALQQILPNTPSISKKTYQSLKPFQSRGEMKTIHTSYGWVTLIDDTYNASLPSMKASLLHLSQLQHSHPITKRIAILGSMAEMGTHSFSYHEKLANFIQSLPIDEVITVGMAWENISIPHHILHYHSQKDISLQKILSLIQNHTVFLIKGSHALQLEIFVQKLLLTLKQHNLL